MRTRLGLIWATAVSLYDELADRIWFAGADLAGRAREWKERLRPLRSAGMVTEADAAAWAVNLRTAVPGEVAPPSAAPQPIPVMAADEPVLDETSPIFDVLTQEWPALWARRERALRMDTMEINVLFGDMTALLAFDYVCTFCEVPGHHKGCPGCSCACRSVAVAA